MNDFIIRKSLFDCIASQTLLMGISPSFVVFDITATPLAVDGLHHSTTLALDASTVVCAYDFCCTVSFGLVWYVD